MRPGSSAEALVEHLEGARCGRRGSCEALAHPHQAASVQTSLEKAQRPRGSLRQPFRSGGAAPRGAPRPRCAPALPERSRVAASSPTGSGTPQALGRSTRPAAPGSSTARPQPAQPARKSNRNASSTPRPPTQASSVVNINGGRSKPARMRVTRPPSPSIRHALREALVGPRRGRRCASDFQPLGQEARGAQPPPADQLDDLEQAFGAAHPETMLRGHAGRRGCPRCR